jgi:YHS domain-containing protein
MKKIAYLSLLLTITLVGGVFAQAPDFAKKFSDAEYHLQYQNYAEALPLYVELADADPNNANVNYKAGFCYLKTAGQKAKAISYLEKAVTNASRNYEEFAATEKRAPEVAFYDLGSAYQLTNQFDKATDMFTKYKNLIGTKDKKLSAEVDRQIAICQFASASMKSPKNITIKNVSGVNSKFPDYEPVLTPDESSLLFTSKREGFGNYQNIDGQYFETAFISNLKDGKWSSPVLLSPNINVDENDGILSVNADGQIALVYRDDQKNGNIWLSEAKGETWNTPVELGANINSKYKERGACLNPEGTIIFFVSDKKGGIGGTDIYMSEKGSDGIWGPATIVKDLSTEYDEGYPYLASDGKTFYFSSEGHETMGGMDILMSTFDASTKSFSKPVNLGYPLNTPEDETSLVMSLDGKTAYFSSTRSDTQGGEDIYMATFNDKAPVAMTIYNGTIINNVDPTATVFPTCKATVTSMTGSGASKTYIANYTTGKFKFAVSPGAKYSVKVEADGNPIFSEDLDLTASSGFQEINRDIKLNPTILTEAEKAALEAEKAAKKAAAEAAEQAAAQAAQAAAKAEAEAEAEANAKGGKGSKNAKDKNGKDGNKKVNPNSLPLAAVEFKTNFKYNATDVAASKDFNDFIKGVAAKIKDGQSVTINIEASASQVPTTKFGTNENLAKSRAESAKTKIINALKAKGVDTSKITWGKMDALVQGPEYNKDFNERRAEYEKFQYVDVTIN